MEKNTSDSTDTLIEQWWELYYTYIFQYIQGYAKCRHEIAQELTQEVFERAFYSLRDRPDGIENPKGWLRKVAENVCKSFYTDTNSHHVYDPTYYTSEGEEKSYLDDLESPEDEQPERVTEKLEVLRWVYALLETLPQEYQRAFWLHYAQGYTYEEIARSFMVNRTPKTISTYARKTREILKGRLEEQEH
ncbi:MAG TPA: RNA polymerase sigma factor [Ktedonobacteraceae bacterium]|nr:RNA polymerase sigma factor [Ktedonobacteraceae bacterium]